VATGAGAEQVELRFLDAVLGFTPGTIQLIVQLYRIGLRTGNVGDDEARVHALGTVFQAGEYASRSVPGRGRITEFTDQALLGPDASVVTLEYLFGQFHTRLKARVAGQADDVLHVGPLAPAQQTLTTESGVAPDDDPYIRPGLTQPRHQQPQHGRCMPGTVNAAGSQQAGQHRLAAEHVQRQVAVVIVIGVELLELLFAM